MSSKTPDKLTPMMKQYRDIRTQIPEEAVLLFRLGDFYEVFFDDAERVASILDIVLTKRAGVPMCGVPYHAIQNYLPRLLEAGVKVAIAEQTEDPKLAKGIVKREITQIITPGTIIDSYILAPERNNFLCALTFVKNLYGLASLDISTGDFRVTELKELSAVETELHSLQARECVIPQSLYEKLDKEKAFPKTDTRFLWTPQPDWIFEFETAEDFLKRSLNVATLDGFGCRYVTAGICAAGAVLYYASENLRQKAEHVKTLKMYSVNDYMLVDKISQRNLELVVSLTGQKYGTLLNVLDKTSTPMGSRLLKDWILRPLADRERITARLNAVETFRENPLTLAEISETIKAIRDLERITARLNIGNANARDMKALQTSLSVLPDLKHLLYSLNDGFINSVTNKIYELPELVSQINEAIIDDPPLQLNEGGIIKQGYSSELDELRQASTEGKKWLAALQAKEQQRTGIKSLKVRYNKVFGYYIEVSKSNLSLIPEDYIRKQTLVNAERFVTPELKEIENRIIGAEEKSKSLEYSLFMQLRDQAVTFTKQIQQTANSLALIDVLLSFAECARKYNYVKPKITNDDLIEIKEGRHPVIETKMEPGTFVPNDTTLDCRKNRFLIITGPNMAGKSTYIRQVALIVLMAQIGSFVPAKRATVGITDRIFTRVGAADNIARGQSTFMVEMVETANILNYATPKSLVILDEIGRGTSTFDGISIAWAVAEYLHDKETCGARTLFATHYHELTELSLTKEGVRNYNVAVREYGDKIIFLRQILPGSTDKSYGIHVAKLAGLPQAVIDRANEILENLENNAIAEAGQPALAKHHPPRKKSKKFSSRYRISEDPKTIQPTLF